MYRRESAIKGSFGKIGLVDVPGVDRLVVVPWKGFSKISSTLETLTEEFLEDELSSSYIIGNSSSGTTDGASSSGGTILV